MTAARFRAGLAALAMAGGLARAAVIHWLPFGPGGLVVDEQYYHRVANFVADGLGYISPSGYDAGVHIATADKPPLFPLLLALESKLGGSSLDAHRFLGCVLGALTILVFGELARRMAGPVAGLVTAALIAFDPTLVHWNSQLLSESLYWPLLGVVLLAGHAMYELPTMRRGIVLGAATALAALTRPEGVLIGALLLVIVLWRHRRAAVRGGLAGAAVCALVIAPWTARNWIAFDRPVILSQQGGEVVGGANCHDAYHGPYTGFWLVWCMQPPPRPRENEADAVARIRATGQRYASAHVGRLPVVVAARVARTWGLWKPAATTWQIVIAWIILGLAVPGVLIARRRRIATAILFVPPVAVTFTSAVGFGWLRYRFSADLVLLVLASLTLTAVGSRLRAGAPLARIRPGRP